MRRVFRGLGVILLVLVLAPVVLAGGGWLWLRNELPQHEGTATVPGLQRPVQVLRDADAVPHIFAATEEDAYYALGYVHAQDRLWQMEMMRRVGAGRLSELFGTRFGDWTLRYDRLMRTLGFYAQAESSVQALSAEVRQAFDAYASGVNAYLATRREALPIEFQLLRHTPEPWKPADSMVWAKLMSLQLAGNYREELTRARVLQRLGPELAEDLYPPTAAAGPVTLAAGLDADLGTLPFDRMLAALPPPLGFDQASNEWVLAGTRTSTGKPILANDPHLGLEAPILWYLARIVTPSFTISGATAPGVPFHPLGHNGHVAWGFTNTHSDVQDLFVEKLDPQDPSRYLTPAGAEPFTTRTETIAVAGQPDEVLTVRRTRHGPVLSGLDGNDDATPPGHLLALAFTGLGERDTSAEALYRLNRARSAAEVRDALFLHQSPQQNVVYADTAGAVGFIAPGLVPVRRKGDGRVPVPGWTGEYDWTGVVPFDELPQALNPDSGQFVNANNAVVGPDYPHVLAVDWPDPYRATRIAELLRKDRHTVEDVVAQQMDSVSLAARDLLPLMLAAPVTDPLAKQAVERLKAWDFAMRRDRPEPLLFEAGLRSLSRALFADELGPLFGEYFWNRPRTVHHVLSTAPRWCDDTGTPAAETCADILVRSLDRALGELKEKHGGDLAAWRWGDAHVAPLAHAVLGRVPGLGRLASLATPTDGSTTTVNRATTRYSNAEAPFADVHGAGYRAVYDLADLGNSRYVIATGQSGNPFSPHWGDFVARWRDGGTVRLAGDPGTLAARGARELTLQPDTPSGGRTP